MNRLLNLLLLMVIVAVGISYFKKDELPPSEDVTLVDNEPIQQPANQGVFDFEYAGRDYIVEPVANYEIWGLVVTHNNIAAFDDIYHDKTSVDIKDICLIWGYNVADDTYKKIKFWSEPWCCNYQTDDREVLKSFSPNRISNNHLLSDDPAVRRAIHASRIGDQIHLKGMLVNYFPKGQSERKRKTSTVRTDTGNGACEVVFVRSFEILGRAAEKWNRTYQYGLLAVFVLLGMKLVLLVRSCFRMYR